MASSDKGAQPDYNGKHSGRSSGSPLALYLEVSAGAVLLIAIVVLLILCRKKKQMHKRIKDYVEERTGSAIVHIVASARLSPLSSYI